MSFVIYIEFAVDLDHEVSLFKMEVAKKNRFFFLLHQKLAFLTYLLENSTKF